MASLIRVEGLRKDYHVGDMTVPALRGIDLDIQRGSFVAVIGASGSGKSTLMNILGLLDQPSAGRYLLREEDVSGLDRDQRAVIRNRTIGFVFQSFNLLPRTSALENVELPLLYNGSHLPTLQRHASARALLEAVGLGGRVHHTPAQLSGGQQQRVAIARALVNEPELILADEPTGNLDSRTSVEIMEILQRLNRERALTVVLITHEPDIAAFLSRTLVFKDGALISDRPNPNALDAAKALAELPHEAAFV